MSIKSFKFGSAAVRNGTTISQIDNTDMIVLDLSTTQSAGSAALALAMAQALMPSPYKSFVGVKYSTNDVTAVDAAGLTVNISYHDSWYVGNAGPSTTRTVSAPVSAVATNDTILNMFTDWYVIDGASWTYVTTEQGAT